MIVHIVIDNKGETVFHFLTVDDILIAAKKKADIDWLLKAMNKDWEVKDLGPISRYLGMRFTEDSRHVYIDLSESETLFHLYCL